jgi:hypothetical protein
MQRSDSGRTGLDLAAQRIESNRRSMWRGNEESASYLRNVLPSPGTRTKQ